jgi:hypothetical protein
VQEEQGSCGTLIFSPQTSFDKQFCSVLSRVHWTGIRLYEVVKFLITHIKRAYKSDGIIFSKCISYLSFQGTTMIHDLRGYATLIWHILDELYWKLRAHEKNWKYSFVDLSLILRLSTSRIVFDINTSCYSISVHFDRYQ